MRCYWCDNDLFNGVTVTGTVEAIDPEVEYIDFTCTWCSHLLAEGNPRGGNPEETLESVKEELQQTRKELHEAEAELDLMEKGGQSAPKKSGKKGGEKSPPPRPPLYKKIAVVVGVVDKFDFFAKQFYF